jgi:hypothetical protein
VARSAYTTVFGAVSERYCVPRFFAASVAVADSLHALSDRPNTAPTPQASALSVTVAALLFVPSSALLVCEPAVYGGLWFYAG